MKKTSNNRVCCVALPPDIPRNTNALLGFLRNLAAAAPGAWLLAESLQPETDATLVKDYIQNHFHKDTQNGNRD